VAECSCLQSGESLATIGSAEEDWELVAEGVNSQNPTGRLHSEALACMLSVDAKIENGNSASDLLKTHTHTMSIPERGDNAE
jgi:hypothetical protein